jgi:hypothetical protein
MNILGSCGYKKFHASICGAITIEVQMRQGKRGGDMS